MPAERHRIVFTEQFFYPDGWGGAQLPRDLTMHLARLGADVEVICGSDQYAPAGVEPAADPRSAGVRIVRVPRFLGGSIHQRKLLRQLFFYAASVPLLFTRRRPSVFVTQTNPPLLVPLIALCALLLRRPFIIIAQDIYPEVMFAHGMADARRISGRVLTRLFSWAYRRAARVVALGPVMARRLIEKGVAAERVEVISNWATGSEGIERGPNNLLRGEWQLENCFVVVYSGNIGIAHDVTTPIAALQILLEHVPNARLLFIGKGSRLYEAQRAAEDAGIAYAVQFRPFVPASRLPQSLGLAHIALVTLREGFEGLVVPSKLLGYMARGVPTLYIGPASDIEQMLSVAGGGESFRNGDATAIAQALQTLIEEPARLASMGASAERYYENHWTREKGLERYASVILGTAADG